MYECVENYVLRHFLISLGLQYKDTYQSLFVGL